MIEAVMQFAVKGKVQTIRQGDLSKHSSNLRGDWKRRFFVLDSQGMLYYHRKEGSKPSAESALDQMDWIEKINGVIASLLSSQTPKRFLPGSPMGNMHRSASDSSSFESSEFDHATTEENLLDRGLTALHQDRSLKSSLLQQSFMKSEKTIDLLRKVSGNGKCADCGAPEPDWASLNLGVLVCIECSGVHRNLGVHISKVRSLTLDFKVWEPSVITLFQSLGNNFANSVWEELLRSKGAFHIELPATSSLKPDKTQQLFISKPGPADSISIKEKFIHAKYAEKPFVRKPKDVQHLRLLAQQIWDGVRNNDTKAVYRYIVNFEADVNGVYELASSSGSSVTLAKAMQLPEQSSNSTFGTGASTSEGTSSENYAFGIEDLGGCSLLHLACETADIGMLELLLQYGTDVNATDSRRWMPLHQCILKANAPFAKLLLSRGAEPRAVNAEGKTPLDLALDSNIEDTALLALLSDTEGDHF